MCLVTSHCHDEGLRPKVVKTTVVLNNNDEAAKTAPEHEEEVDICAAFEKVDCDEVLHYFVKRNLLMEYFNPNKPWVLVPEGSFNGYFEWVPLRFRDGPWHPACAAYLGVLSWWVYSECTKYMAQDPYPEYFEPVQAFTASWYYNVIGFAWTSYIVYKIFKSGMGWTSWGMYTVWSWTFTTLRHGLCAGAPFKPEWTRFSEQLRFPALVQATLTFAIWNAVIGPSIYAQMKSPATKASFCRFFGNPLWRQLHVYNILYAAINGVWGSPARLLTGADFAGAFAFCLIYAYFYVLVLDRFGVHYYLVFSPRTPFALISWTLIFGSYYVCFPLWNAALGMLAPEKI